MKFDGINFRRAKSLIILPQRFFMGDAKNYVAFGKRVSGELEAKYNNSVGLDNSVVLKIKAGEYTRKNGTPAPEFYAIPVRLTGHSLTNLAYGANGRMYLAYDGLVYTALTPKAKRERAERIVKPRGGMHDVEDNKIKGNKGEAASLTECALALIRDGDGNNNSLKMALWRLVDAAGMTAELLGFDGEGASNATGRGYRIVKG